MFKVGDVVKCIDPCDWEWANIEEGKVYTVVGLTQVLGPGVHLEGFSNWVYEYRFVLDESPAQESYLELFI